MLDPMQRIEYGPCVGSRGASISIGSPRGCMGSPRRSRAAVPQAGRGRPQGTGCGRRGSSPWPVSSGRRCPDRGRRRNGRGSGPTHLGCTSPYGTATTCRSSPRIVSSASRVTLIRDRAGVVERRMIQLHPRQLSSPPTTGAVLGPRRVLPPRLGFRLLGVQRERP
jgi:hypothetical protein